MLLNIFLTAALTAIVSTIFAGDALKPNASTFAKAIIAIPFGLSLLVMIGCGYWFIWTI